MRKPLRIFISYGRDEHVELSRCLKNDLRDQGHEVWFDEDCLMPGFDWEAHIEKGLEWCSEMGIMISSPGESPMVLSAHNVRE